MFDWENAIARHAMQGNRASSRGKGKVSWVFSSCGRHRDNLCIFEVGIKGGMNRLLKYRNFKVLEETIILVVLGAE